MSVETLRDAVAKLSCDGATSLALVGALSDAGLLDAIILPRTCSTCGGSREVVDHVAVEGADAPFPSAGGPEYVPCPDCPPPLVVERKAWEAFRTAVNEFEERGGAWSEADGAAQLLGLAQALLGQPLLRVKEVVRTCRKYDRVTVEAKKPREVVRIPLKTRPGDRIVILEPVTACHSKEE